MGIDFVVAISTLWNIFEQVGTYELVRIRWLFMGREVGHFYESAIFCQRYSEK
jgi:hypothetical protein